MLQIGDVIIVKRFGNPISEAITVWSKMFSHVEPVIDANGSTVEATVPKIRFGHISNYFQGKHRVAVLRPAIPLNDDERRKFVITACDMVGRWYDVWSLIGHVINKRLQKAEYYNCAELTLQCFKSIGRLTQLPIDIIKPSHFFVLACGGFFRTVFYKVRPTKIDYEKLMMEV